MTTTTKTKTDKKPFTRVFLRNNYGSHAWTYLRDYLKPLPRAKKEQQKYVWSREAPTAEEATELRNKHFTTTLEELASDAFSEIESLSGEMQEWYDNMPENFQQGDKGSEVEEAKDALENISTVELSGEAAKLTTVYIPAENIESRGDRINDCVSRLNHAAETLRDELQDLIDAAPKDDPYKDAEGWGDIADELESAAQEADGISFPGMY
jgi:hypothetical protein